MKKILIAIASLIISGCSDYDKVGEDIIHFDVPVAIFWYVELLNNHITSDQITGIPLPIQVAKNSSNALQGSPSISSR